MSFKCYFCEKTSQLHEKMRLIPTRIRNVNYDNGYRGTEIVSERQCCESCWFSGTEAHVANTNLEIQVAYEQSSPEFLAKRLFE